jgi:prevent-host-death family protein
MNMANISYTRNHLSELLNRVREGETVLIMDRNRPVARLEPMAELGTATAAWKNDLVRRGIVRPARQRLDTQALKAISVPVASDGGDMLEALRVDREEDR